MNALCFGLQRDFWAIQTPLRENVSAELLFFSKLESNKYTDDFYHYLRKGAIPPHLLESNEQNMVVIEAFLEAAKRFVCGGYDVIVDGIIGPWFLEPWRGLVREHFEVHYIILRASKEETLKRAIERSKLDRKTNIELVEAMWMQFNSLNEYERYVLETTGLSVDETILMIKETISKKTNLLV